MTYTVSHAYCSKKLFDVCLVAPFQDNAYRISSRFRDVLVFETAEEHVQLQQILVNSFLIGTRGLESATKL